MDIRRVFALFLIVAVASFLGFCVENLWLMMRKGYMNNRNMYLPFLLGYGIAMVAICALFGTPQAPRFLHITIAVKSLRMRSVLYFLIVCLCVMAGEITLGTFVEKMCGIVWWNYSGLPMHITKYTSVPTTIAFGTLITWFMGCFFTPLYESFLRMDFHALGKLSCTLMLLMVADFIHSGINMYKNRKLLELWQIDMSHTRLHRIWTERVEHT